MKFLINNELPPALARFIPNELEAEAIHVIDVDQRDASDVEVWTYASANDMIVISKDADFAGMLLNTPTTKLVWLRVGNYRREHLLEVFGIWTQILEWLDSNDSLIEITESLREANAHRPSECKCCRQIGKGTAPWVAIFRLADDLGQTRGRRPKWSLLLDPKFVNESADDHPLADIRNGWIFLNQIYNGVTISPLWPNIVFASITTSGVDSMTT